MSSSLGWQNGGLRAFHAMERRLLCTGAMPTRHEQRRSKRLSAYIDVKLCRKTGDVPARGTYLNADGMFLETNVPVERGAKVELRLALPDRELAVFATVVSVLRTSGRGGLGLEFYMMSSSTRLAWLSFYQSLLAREDAAAEAKSVVATQADPAGPVSGN
jgi:hypothetical protein